MFRAIFLICVAVIATRAQVPSVKIITTDIDAFWSAYDAFKNDTSLNPFIEYQRHGTDALKDFLRYRVKDSLTLKTIVKKEMAYYDGLRAYTSQLNRFEDRVIKDFMAFQKVYPHAVLPEVFLVVGLLRGDLSVTAAGVTLGAEYFADSLLKTSEGYAAAPVDEFPAAITTGIIYFNQKPAHTGYTVLRECIVHGSVLFVKTLFMEGERAKLFKIPAFEYGEANEELVMRKFLSAKDSNDLTEWLFHKPADQTVPANVGKWVGFKIVEAYYQNGSDKVKALDEIFKINDFEKFLRLSGYAEPFRY